MELVNGAKAEWKPEKENCTVYSFPGVAACGEPGCGSQREQMMKVICFLFALTNLWFVYSLTVNQDGVGERAEIIQSLSQLRWQLSLPKRALQFVRFKMLIYNWTSAGKRNDFAVYLIGYFT